MTGDKRCIFAGSHDDSTTSSSKAQTSPCLTCPLQFGSFDLFGAILFSLVSSACAVKGKTQLFCWTQTEPRANCTSLSNATTYTTDSADHRERYAVDQDFPPSTVCNTLNRSAKVTSFRQCTQCPSPSVGVFAGVGSLRRGGRQRLCIAGHWSIQISVEVT